MKNLNTFFIVLILLCSSVTIAQTVFRGTVIDANTKQPIAQARVGISNQGIGEITNSKGFFNYRKYHEVIDSKSELVVGAPGYESLQLDAEKLRSLFNIYSKIELKPTSSSKKQKNKNVKDLTVFWDVSEDMKYRNIEAEIEYVQNYASSYKNLTLHLVIFDDEIRSKEQIQVRDGDITRFRESVKELTYRGVSNYDLLDISGTDAVILSSNGKPIFGELGVSQEVPVNIVVSQKVNNDLQYLRNLAAYTSGKFNLVNSTGIISDEQVTALSEKSELIKGNINSLGIRLEGVSISIGNSFTEYISDVDGNFEIPAKLGDDIKFNYFRMFPKTVRIKNIDEFLKVEMIPKDDQLDEVILIGQKSDKVIVGGRILKGEDGLMNATGDEYITSKDIPKNAEILEDILKENFPSVRNLFTSQGLVFTIGGVRVPLYIDENLVREGLPFFIEANDVESIIVKTNDVLSNRYGPYVNGQAIFVTTKNNELSKAKYDPLVKGNDYNEQVAVLPSKTSDYDNVIEGRVVGPQGPIQGASIIIKGSFDEYTSRADGRFTIPANIGDEVHISYLGMFTTSFIVNDFKVSKEIELIPKNDILNEVKLAGKKRKEDELITTNAGKVSRDSYGFASHYLGSKDIPAGKNSLLDVLNGRFSGVRVSGEPNVFIFISPFRGRTEPPVVIIDGVVYGQNGNTNPISGGIPDVNAQDIESITILKGPSAAYNYGPVANGGAVIIELKSGNISNKKTSAKSLEVQGNEYIEELDYLESSDNISTQISGTITGPQGPIQGASINIKGSFDEYTSDVNGSFTIPARKGDVVVFSYLGMYPKGEVIQDLDAKLLVNLISKNELLDEIVLEGSSTEKETIETAYGKEEKDKVGYAINSLNEGDIKSQYQFLSDLLRGQFSGVQVLGQGNDVKLIVRQGGLTLGGANGSGNPLYVVDNILIADRTLGEMNTLIDVQNIEKVTILKSYASTNIYGSIAVDGAVIIKTKTGESTLSNESKAPSLLVKGNDYQESDLQSADVNDALPSYIKEIQQIPSIDTRFERYTILKEEYATDIEFYVDMALYFKKYDSQKTQNILSDLTIKGKSNVKVLRTVAYIYESLKEFKQAQYIYERILKLEPSAAQSYRDVAMIYQYTGAYEKALELYINMLGEQIKGIDFSGLEKPLISELSRLIAKHKDKIDYERLPNQWLKSNFNIDVRMVIDWSDRTAPFEFQFVNPNKKYYKWTHDLERNSDRLKAEQKHGFQTEEFIIDDAPSGEWLVNIQYLGLEEDYVLPPFMKYTIYKNFGTKEETSEVRVVKLFRQLNKVTLGKIVL